MPRYSRIIRQITSSKIGPTVVFFGGIHGNEKSGVQALEDTLKGLSDDIITGNIYALAGNLKALEKNQRYLNLDLNRMWSSEDINAIKTKSSLIHEERELLELYDLIDAILKKHEGPFYFFDLHTTSSKSLPFITINDAIINRSFSKQFPVPIVLGIEEYLDGALLSYINQLGYVSLGFESGQHDDIQSVKNHIAFINIALVFTGLVDSLYIKGFDTFYNQLKNEGKYNTRFFEIIDLQRITKDDEFKMCNGFDSFQTIHKGEKIATNKNGIISSRYNAKIFMPLYQQKGSEGFFIIRSINTLFLKLSVWLRLLRADSLLSMLPGIIWYNKQKGILKVNLKVAKYMAKPIFHLLGYRNKQVGSTNLLLYNRERVAKTKMYKGEKWYR
ncbi:succinylglutamate desuccinylase/aspartoacylase domain-containing protein [Aestuariivivens sediminis]|uniref:succinylglutamate desuccinylase/aspartoacylase domain-containing protein n=1 Tax=Aestuariivivens sediminis TaxID=2913557 RepID=UPI001F57FFA4|nr:succinylglutamate desuccinylase/aspartoacylase family protein [Aestuariivivens sediminis]